MPEKRIQDLIGSKERVKLTISHCRTDRVPKGEIVIEDSVILESLKKEKIGFDERLKFVNQLGLDLICLNPKYPSINGDLPTIGSVIWPDLKDWVSKSNLFTFAMLDGILGWGIRIFGYKQFFVLPKTSPLVFAAFIKKVELFNLGQAIALIDRGIDGLIIADDLAYSKGLIFGPETTRRYFLPSFASQIEEISRTGIPVFFHSDGNLNDIMEDIVEVGFAGLHCIDRNSGMDVIQLQRDFGKKICLWGSLSVEDLLKIDDQKYLEIILAEISLLSSNKGFILGTDCGLFSGLNLEGLVRIYKLREEKV